MAVLSRVNYGAIELLQVDSDPNGVSALTNSLAVLTTNNSVYKNVDGTTWVLFAPVATTIPNNQFAITSGSKILGKVYTENGAMGAEAGTITPLDDTIPQLSEGSVCLTSTPITTKSSTSTIRITFNGVFAVNIVGRGIIHVHRNNAANAEYVTTLTAGGSAMPTSANPHTASSVFFNYETSSPGAGQTLTYKVIFSAVSTAATTANGQATAIRYGANRLAIMVDEIEYY